MRRISLMVRFAASFRSLTGLQRRRERSKSGSLILVYHGVAQSLRNDELDTYQIIQAELRQHIKYLKQLAEIVPLRELLENCEQFASSRQRAVAITFDDALASQVTLAADVLDEFDIPWSIAVPAGLVEHQEPVWTNQVRFIANMLTPGRSRFSNGRVVDTAMLSNSGAGLIDFLMNEISSNERDDLIRQLLNEVGEARVHEAMVVDGRFLMSSWEQLREVSKRKCDILSHGWNHRPHNSTLTDEDRVTEIVASYSLIEKRLGVAPVGFAYPHGITSPSSEALLADAGYQFALSTHASWFHKLDRWKVPRIDGEYQLSVLRRHLTWRR